MVPCRAAEDWTNSWIKDLAVNDPERGVSADCNSQVFEQLCSVQTPALQGDIKVASILYPQAVRAIALLDCTFEACYICQAFAVMEEVQNHPSDLCRAISLRYAAKWEMMDLLTKAHLISIGTIEVPGQVSGQVPEQSQGQGPSGPASTSGPGAGGQSIFFQSGDRIVRLSVVGESELRLKRLDEGVAILQDDEEVSQGRLVEPLLHCPDQAYITVSERCIYDCKFCAVPKLHGGVKSSARVRAMAEQAAATGRLRAISLTSGVEASPEHEARRVAAIASDLKRLCVPIGVSVSPFPGVNEILRNAGVEEVKYNIETLDQDLFGRVCPGFSFEVIMDSLKEAVGIFGRNRVFSNVIIGLGESDKTLRSGIDELTEMGVLPVLRAVYPHPLRVGEIEMSRPNADRLLDLAYYLRKALDKNGLQGDLALTGCYRCTGCDLVPHRDL